MADKKKKASSKRKKQTGKKKSVNKPIKPDPRLKPSAAKKAIAKVERGEELTGWEGAAIMTSDFVAGLIVKGERIPDEYYEKVPDLIPLTEENREPFYIYNKFAHPGGLLKNIRGYHFEAISQFFHAQIIITACREKLKLALAQRKAFEDYLEAMNTAGEAHQAAQGIPEEHRAKLVCESLDLFRINQEDHDLIIEILGHGYRLWTILTGLAEKLGHPDMTQSLDAVREHFEHAVFNYYQVALEACQDEKIVKDYFFGDEEEIYGKWLHLNRLPPLKALPNNLAVTYVQKQIDTIPIEEISIPKLVWEMYQIHLEAERQKRAKKERASNG